MGKTSGAYELNHECAYFDYNTTVPLQCVALFFGKLMLTGCCLVDCFLGSP